MKIFILLVSVFICSISTLKADQTKPLQLNIQQAISLAAKQNAKVLAANKRVLQALANISINKAVLMPQVSGVFGGKRQTIDTRASGIQFPGDPHIGPFNSFDTRGQLTMEIFDPEAMARIQSGNAGERLSRAELAKVKQDLMALVGTMFLEAKRAKESLEVSQISLKEYQLQFQVIKTRYKQGLSTEAEFQKARVDLSKAQYSLQASLTHAHDTQLDLASVLKLPLDQELILNDSYTGWGKEFQQADISADVRVAQTQLEQARAEENQARRKLWPKIMASGDLGREGESFDHSSSTYSLGVLVKIPVWEGGATQAQIKKAQLKSQENEILLNDTKDQSDVALRKAKEHLVQARSLVSSKSDELIYAKYQLKIIQGLLKSGQASDIDLAHYESLYAIAKDDYQESQALYWTAIINLGHALGKIEEMFSAKDGSASAEYK